MKITYTESGVEQEARTNFLKVTDLGNDAHRAILKLRASPDVFWDDVKYLLEFTPAPTRAVSQAFVSDFKVEQE